MSLRIEICDLFSKTWDYLDDVAPGHAYPLDQILYDGPKTYLISCDTDNHKSVIYESLLPRKEFDEKITSEEGLHVGEDLAEHVVIESGEVYKMSIQISPETRRQVLRFEQV